jgi:phage tail P2-like protein
MSKYSYKPDSLLPRVYPQNEHALDRAGGLRVDKLSLDLEVVRDLANPHLCPTEFLPLLAFAFGSDFYWELENLSEIEQREMIASSLELHRKKGTLWAIKKVLSILGFDVEIVEWWEDDFLLDDLEIKPTNPYTFAVVLDVSKFYKNSIRILSENEQRRVLKYLHIYKNVRSHFDFYLKINLQQNFSPVPITQLTELKTEELESKDFSKVSTNSIGYTNTVGIQDTEMRNLESKDLQYPKRNIDIVNFCSLKDTAIFRAESKPNIHTDRDIKAKTIGDFRESAIFPMQSNPTEEVNNEMAITMRVKMTEVVMYG